MQFTRSLILLCTAALAATAVAESMHVGCFTDITSTTAKSASFNSRGVCNEFCSATTDYFAMNGIDCLCLDALPEAVQKTDGQKCGIPCPGFGVEKCGGKTGEYSVYSGSRKHGDEASASATSSSATSASENASKTQTASASSTESATKPATTSAAANSTSTAGAQSNTTIPQQVPQNEDHADSAAGRNVASLAAAVMVAAGFAML